MLYYNDECIINKRGKLKNNSVEYVLGEHNYHKGT